MEDPQIWQYKKYEQHGKILQKFKDLLYILKDLL